MNERIDKLAEEAGFASDKLGNLFGGDEIEKFAELIIEECLDLIDDERKPEMVSRVELWKQIKQHFGVKE